MIQLKNGELGIPPNGSADNPSAENPNGADEDIQQQAKKNAVLILFLLVWALFIIKGFIYSSITPLWEGIDETFHFAYVQSLAATGVFPVWGETVVDGEIARSTAYVPLPPLMAKLERDFQKLSYYQYWQMPPDQRQQYAGELRKLKASAAEIRPSSSLLYQAQHPPLYYLLCVPLYKLLDSWSLIDKVFAIRFFSVLLASISIIAAALVARGRGMTGAACAVLVALWPGFYVDVARVGNDSLGAAIFSLIFLAMLLYAEKRTHYRAGWLGLLLGLGLLTKAYFLPAVPAIAIFVGFVAMRYRGEWKRVLAQGCIIFLVAAAVAGWWYVRNHVLYGTFSGLQESIYFPSVGLHERIHAIFQVNWSLLLKHLFVSFAWVSGWSFLHLPKAAYLTFAVLLAVAGVGLGRKLLEMNRQADISSGNDHAFAAAALLLLFFALGIAYHQINVQATVKVMGGPGGWYLYALVVPISYILAMGMMGSVRRFGGWCFLVLAGALFIIDLYGFFRVLLPYYTGTAHPAGDGWGVEVISSVQISAGEALLRLMSNKPDFLSPAVLGVAAAVYVLVFAAVIILFALSAGEQVTCSPKPASRESVLPAHR